MKLSGSGGIGVVLAIKLAENNPVQGVEDVGDGLKEEEGVMDKVGEVGVVISDTDDIGVCEADAARVAVAAVAVALVCVVLLVIDVTLFDNAKLVIMFWDEAVWITVALFVADVVTGKIISVTCASIVIDGWILVTMAGIGAFILMGMTMSPSDVSNETFVVQLKCTFFYKW